jgi:hypothetical protein
VRGLTDSHYEHHRGCQLTCDVKTEEGARQSDVLVEVRPACLVILGTEYYYRDYVIRLSKNKKEVVIVPVFKGP